MVTPVVSVTAAMVPRERGRGIQPEGIPVDSAGARPPKEMSSRKHDN